MNMLNEQFCDIYQRLKIILQLLNLLFLDLRINMTQTHDL